MKKTNWLVWLIVIVLGIGGYVYFQGQMQTEKIPTEDKNMMEDTEMKKSYVDVSPETAMMMIKEYPQMVIIDVSPKYKEGHIPGAINYYIGDGSLAKAVPTLDKNSKYLVYCHVDSASIPGAQMLVDAGISDVYRLKGNYSAWVEAGYPVDK